MILVWKLLRQHISIPQFAGFFFANLFGMLIVLLGYQFYNDVAPVFTAEDSFMKSDFLIVNKKIGTASTISGRSNTFTDEEIDDLSQQPFVSSVGKFTGTAYKVDANMSVNGTSVLNNGEINEKSFMRGHLGVVLTADGRRSVIQAHERRLDAELKHPLFGYQVSYRRVLDLQARVLAASFTGELDSYTPLMTR